MSVPIIESWLGTGMESEVISNFSIFYSSFNGHTAVEDFVAVNIISVQIMDELDRRNL